jgi:SAM-dependent methyltransferase
MTEKTSTFDELLNVFWLRPETALWRQLDVLAMRDFDFTGPSLDLGCGDGVFSFIRAGGQFAKEFDAFRAVGSLDKFFDNVDVFDHFDAGFRAAMLKAPDYQIDMGFDHKENLLKKANSLGLYKETKVGDANGKLPFADGSFSRVFSNIVYWLDDPKQVIAEISRVLKPGGRACLMLPNNTLPEFSFYNQLHLKNADPAWAFLERLDRGRFADNIQHAKSAETWNSYVTSAGLKIAVHRRHLSKPIIQMWDVGLRPLFPVLLKMVEQIPAANLPPIKSEWVDIFKLFLEPMLAIDHLAPPSPEPGFHCYILEK